MRYQKTLRDRPKEAQPLEKRRRSLGITQEKISEIIGCDRSTITHALTKRNSEVLVNVPARRRDIDKVLRAVEQVGYDDLRRFVDVHGHDAFLSDALDVDDLPQRVASLPFPGQGDGHDTEPAGIEPNDDPNASPDE